MRGSVIRRFCLCSLAALCCSDIAFANEIGVAGLFPGKAVLVVNGAAPKTYPVGAQVAHGIHLVSVGDSAATLEIQGKRQTIAIGAHSIRTARSSTGPATAALTADGRGHFMANGQINGGAMTMMVDTGATMIALPASDALRLGINYRNGQVGQVNTANGVASAYRVKLDSVRIGDIELHHVDALVQESGLGIGLLGMSFLNRTVMQRDGDRMILTKRY